jgi:mannose-6-phosphate isomerase-like protein (cupin superfamily)
MHDKKYFVGKISDYIQKKGWFFGHFMEEELLRSDLVEVAYQDVPDKKADPEDWHYHKKTVEINIVLSGSATFKINGETVKVEKEGFWVVYPGTVIEDFSTEKDTKLVVIKAPSLPNDKFTKTL